MRCTRKETDQRSVHTYSNVDSLSLSFQGSGRLGRTQGRMWTTIITIGKYIHTFLQHYALLSFIHIKSNPERKPNDDPLSLSLTHASFYLTFSTYILDIIQTLCSLLQVPTIILAIALRRIWLSTST